MIDLEIKDASNPGETRGDRYAEGDQQARRATARVLSALAEAGNAPPCLAVTAHFCSIVNLMSPGDLLFKE